MEVVLRDGVVAERGSHQDLLERNGVYASMFHRQAAGYRDVPVAVGETS